MAKSISNQININEKLIKRISSDPQQFVQALIDLLSEDQLKTLFQNTEEEEQDVYDEYFDEDIYYEALSSIGDIDFNY